MRLGQLARKLALRPSELVRFLEKNNIQIEEGSNTRLEDEHVSLIMKEFAPEMAAEITAELAAEKEIPVVTSTPEGVVPSEEQTENSKVEFLVSDNTEPRIEVIKAPKVELTGLKVLGKIDLPEPKKKEPQPTESAAIENAVPVEEQKKAETRKSFVPRREQRPVKNPIALQREREAVEAEKKRRANSEREKEKRTQNYLKKVKTPAPTKAMKIVKEQVEEIIEEKADPPKTWLGKFFRWMNT